MNNLQKEIVEKIAKEQDRALKIGLQRKKYYFESLEVMKMFVHHNVVSKRVEDGQILSVCGDEFLLLRDIIPAKDIKIVKADNQVRLSIVNLGIEYL